MKKRLFDVAVNTITARLLRTKTAFEADATDELSYISGLDEPTDDIERSYKQYQCQCYLRKKYATLLLNFASSICAPFFIFYCLLRRASLIKEYDIVYSISIKDKSIIPNSLIECYPQKYITNEYDGFSLNYKDLKFILALISHYPFSPYFILKNIIKISIYRYFITAYNPKAIAINSEFSCCSSIMTKYCEDQSIEHINIMHGEKLFYIRDSFFRFTKCFVWDDFYIELFKKLRAIENVFIIEKPQSLIIDLKKLRGLIPVVDFKYILFENTKLEEVSATLKNLKERGYSVKVRPHPAYSNLELVRELFDSNDIEDCNISIQTSVANSKHVISLYSTVLYQAYLNGIDYILDDINYLEEFEKIKELDYILISKKHNNLSDVLYSL